MMPICQQKNRRMNRNILGNSKLLFVSRLILGALFIYASYDKAINPLGFAQIMHNYRVAPPSLINIASVMLPWIELLAGVLLIIGCKARGANLLIIGLLVFYIVLLTVTMIRGINVSCGCFSTSQAAKSNLLDVIFRDIGMLILGIHILLFYKTGRRVTA